MTSFTNDVITPLFIRSLCGPNLCAGGMRYRLHQSHQPIYGNGWPTGTAQV
jgi:hypothetical protein